MDLRSTLLKTIAEVKNNRMFFLLLLAIYPLGVTIGILCGVGAISYTTNFHSDTCLHEQLYTMEAFNRFIRIAQNNMLVCFKCLFCGAFSFGFFSLLLLAFNGFVLGEMIGRSSHLLTIQDIISSTIPHSMEFVGIAIFGLISRILSKAFISKQYLDKIKICIILSCIGSLIIIISAAIESYVSISN